LIAKLIHPYAQDGSTEKSSTDKNFDKIEEKNLST
jgi:hypothetical protein